MSARWFRFYDEALDDPKVQLLPDDLFKAWVNVLCVASRNEGAMPKMADLAFLLKTTVDGAKTVLLRLHNAGLIDKVNGGVNGFRVMPHGWEKRQFKSDSSAPRMRKLRAKNVTSPSRARFTETDTEVSKAQIPSPSLLPRKDSLSSDSAKPVASPDLPVETEAKKPKRRIRKKVEPPVDFMAVWWRYPAPRRGDKPAAIDHWVELSPDERVAAAAGLSAYLGSCREEQFVKHFRGYLSGRLWEAFTDAEPSGPKVVDGDGPLVAVPHQERSILMALVPKWRHLHEGAEPKVDDEGTWLPQAWVARMQAQIGAGRKQA